VPIDAAEFRRVLGHWVTGVAVVAATRSDGTPCGLTATAVTSLSLDPPLVLVCVERSANSHDCIHQAGAFSVNILPESAERVARRFAENETSDKFAGISYRTEASGAPVLGDAMAWVDCSLHEALPGGDHTIFIGQVLAADAREAVPLVYYRGGYGRFSP
jgi:flavin reductase (DIM6/NTAB) family NADH-FMN oxidoreductase RutF